MDAKNLKEKTNSLLETLYVVREYHYNPKNPDLYSHEDHEYKSKWDARKFYERALPKKHVEFLEVQRPAVA